jgi:hypothetical protein
MTERFGSRVVPVHPGLVTSDYDVHEVEVTVCGVQHVLEIDPAGCEIFILSIIYVDEFAM